MGLFARCHCVDSVLRQLHVIPFINHYPDYLISALVAEVEVLAITGATGSSEQLLGEDDMRQLEEQHQRRFATIWSGRLGVHRQGFESRGKIWASPVIRHLLKSAPSLDPKRE